MNKRKRAIWYTDYSVEQCKTIFKEKIPAVYNTPLTYRSKQKYITGDIQDNGDFFLAKESNSKNQIFELWGNLKELDGGGTEVTIKNKPRLRMKIFYIVFLIISVCCLAVSILRLTSKIVEKYDFLNIFWILWLPCYIVVLFNAPNARLWAQVQTMFNCKRKKI